LTSSGVGNNDFAGRVDISNTVTMKCERLYMVLMMELESERGGGRGEGL
jgi:hypothetical protein